MSTRRDESLLTAYVLGEVNASERAEVEAWINESEEARTQLEEIRQSVAFLEGEFEAEPVPELTAQQRAAIAAAAGEQKPSWTRWMYPAVGLAAAASLAVVVGIQLMPELQPQLSTLEGFSGPEGVSNVPVLAGGKPAAVGNEQQEAGAGRTQLRLDALDSVGDRDNVARARQEVRGDKEEFAADLQAQPAQAASQTGDTVKQPAVYSSLSEMDVSSVQEFRLRLESERASEPKQVKNLPLNSQGTLSLQMAGGVPPGAPGGVIGGAPTAPLPVKIHRTVLSDEDRPIRRRPDFNTEAYDRIVDNPFVRVDDDPRSTFSIDVDTASYANMRRFLSSKQLPPKDSVRIEEMINYFNYDYSSPSGKDPFSTHIEVTSAPWKPQHRLLRVGLKGREIDMNNRPAGNFVFLLDVSGSMSPSNKLPLVKRAMRLLVDELGPQDRIAMVVYAGASGLVLPSTTCDEKQSILDSLDRLGAGGSTNGGQGIELAYKVAQQNFIKGGINRVILATDGDFNVGLTNQGDLTRLIEEKAKGGVFLSVLGFGMGNYKDSNLKKLADQGNGNYAYIDSIREARKVLVEEVGGTLVTIAKDVKIQLEFNPAQVTAFRLIGYENRVLEHQDFNDDTKDAGEIGAGHTVTALYEIVPAGVEIELPSVDPLKYQNETNPVADAGSELLTVKLRYKQPDGDTSQLVEVAVVDAGGEFARASTDLRFAASVAGFGMLLRDSPYKGGVTFEDVTRWAEAARGADKGGYRAEFIKLVRAGRALRDLEGLRN